MDKPKSERSSGKETRWQPKVPTYERYKVSDVKGRTSNRSNNHSSLPVGPGAKNYRPVVLSGIEGSGEVIRGGVSRDPGPVGAFTNSKLQLDLLNAKTWT